jgi:hypothetical protein
MTLTPFRGRCHTCGHDHDAEDVRLRDLMAICDQARVHEARTPAPAEAWLPIETAPKDEDTHILLADAEFVGEGFWQPASEDGVDEMGSDAGFVDMHYSYFSPSRSFGAEKYRSVGTQPTHWMPLPAAPKDTP